MVEVGAMCGQREAFAVLPASRAAYERGDWNKQRGPRTR